MLNNFIYAQSKAMFEERIAEVPTEAIVFIEDTKEIWTHGTYFDCSTLDPSIIPNIQTEVDELRMSFNNKADVDGNYPDMTVGFAEDLGGAEFTQESEFTIRATADGESVKDGAARIESVKGNSVVWNQLWDINGDNRVDNVADKTIVGAETIITLNSGGQFCRIRTAYATGVNGHVYAISYAAKYNSKNDGSLLTAYVGFSLSYSNQMVLTDSYQNYSDIWEGDYSGQMNVGVIGTRNDGDVVSFKDIRIIDLTKMFGQGNEPTTIEEFYARIPMGVDLNVYNEGEVIHMDAQSIESIGINAFDNVWESGDISGTTGVDYDNTSTIRTGYISVIPGETYYITVQGATNIFMRARLYDADRNFIGIESANGEDIYSSREFTLPSNAHYIRFAPNVSNITVDNLVCLNISNTSLNDQYFSYVKNTQNLDIVVNYFPDGMKSAGNVCDEIRYNKATGKWETVKRIGEAVMDSFNWAYQGVSSDYPYGFFYTNLNSDLTDKAIGGALLCKLYSDGGFNVNKSIASNASNKMVYVRDSSYTDVESFKTAMSGIILYYELATPIITEIEDPGFAYQVWNGGTENIIAEKSSPLVADITYNFSANEWIKQNRFDIEKLNTSLGTYYAVCDSKSHMAVKEVNIPSLTNIVNGTKIVIKFTNNCIVPPSTLNVNGKLSNIKYGTDGSLLPNALKANAIVEFTYSDDVWYITGGYQYDPYINGLKGGNLSSITNYGVCSTAADATAKTVSVGGNFSLVTGAQVVVKFANGNTANLPTLNVNNTGSKTITWGSYSGARYMNADEILTFVYGGTNWYCKSSSSALTSGNLNMGYSLQALNSETCGLAISAGQSIMDSVDGALYINKGISSGSNAIYCNEGNIVTENGFFDGAYVHNTRVITSTATLNDIDSLVLYNSTSNVTITMPSNPVDGQIITFIKPNGTGTITFSASTGILNAPQDSTSNSKTIAVTTVGVRKLYYINSKWYIFLQ